MNNDVFSDFALDRARTFPLPQRALQAIDEALRDARWEMVHQLREMEQLLAARPEAVVLAAPSTRCQLDYRSSWKDDWAFDVRRGGARVSMWFHREPAVSSATGQVLHAAGVWSGFETRSDVFGNEWRRDLGGYFLTDDFGDLVEVPAC